MDSFTLAEDKVHSGQPYFDRQERIEWWNQARLFDARVLVVGAGALGNEVLKNLALLGVGHIVVIDFDVVEDSNLSRSVLFRTCDAAERASKAEIAAERSRAMNPHPQAIVKGIHGDVVWELGAGVYRHADLVLGCLDNLEARLAVNVGCWRAGKTWIDGGMWGLSGSVGVYDASIDTACYECSMSPDRYRMAKVRYSCTNETVKRNIRQGREPTTQTTSAVVAAIQSQEAVKLLHGLPSFSGRQLMFSGAPHAYTNHDHNPITLNELTVNPSCICHGEDRWGEVIELAEACANRTTARELLTLVAAKTGLHNLALDLGRTFVVKAICSQCGRETPLDRTLHKIHDTDIVCLACTVTCPTCGFISVGKPDCPNCGQQDINEPRLETFHALSPDLPQTAPFLDYTLAQLGIPQLHVLSVNSDQGQRINVELTGDMPNLWVT